jgi:hypothetical protein
MSTRKVKRPTEKGFCGFCFRERRIVAVWGPPDCRLGVCVTCDKRLSALAELEAELALSEMTYCEGPE